MKVDKRFSSKREGWRWSGFPRLAIIGRGFSGMMTAIALMKTVRAPFHLQLYDPSPSLSGGQALSAHAASTILNNRVRDLSVSVGEPDDFNRWLSENEDFRAAVPAAIPGFRQIFVPKQIFSDYVYQRFSQALAGRPEIAVRVCQDAVISLQASSNGTFTLQGSGSGAGEFDAVILATGYGIAQDGVQVALGDLGENPPSAVLSHILLLGSGIRVVDQLLQLREGGYEGRVSVVSDHGFLPQTHTPNAAEPIFPAEAMPQGLPAILRFIRTACRQAEADGRSWQSVMNGLRLHAWSLWRDLPPAQKHQFNRHLRAIYDSHRNRLPEAIHARLIRELNSGNTRLIRGKRVAHDGRGIKIRNRNTQAEMLLEASRIIDCRCREPDLSSPLIRSLLDQGLAERDELGLGLAVDERGVPHLPSGERSVGLFALGPLGLGSLPDIDLVPEIVSQAYAVAEDIDRHFVLHSAAV